MSPSPTLSQVPILGPSSANLQAKASLRFPPSAIRARRSDRQGAAARAKHGRIAMACERSNSDIAAHVPIYVARVGPTKLNAGGRPARVKAVGEFHTSFLELLCRS